jgi:predicted PurR-regulated permease PerM
MPADDAALNRLRASSLVIALAAIALLYICRPLLVPLMYGMFLAIIIFPFCRRMELAGIRRSFAILLCLLTVSLFFAGIVVIVLYQYRLFRDDLPLLWQRLQPVLADLVIFLEKAGVGSGRRDALYGDLFQAMGGEAGAFVKSGLTGTVNATINLFIIPLYAALMLFYREKLLVFLAALLGRERQMLHGIFVQAVVVYSEYIKGMIWVYFIVGVLNSVGLLLLGVRYAILFGMITAVMTIIPYFGIIVSSLLPISVAWLTTGSVYYPLGVVLVFTVVQYLEANFIYPYVVGRRVHVNLLASLVSVFAGGLLWGISGLVLFLPLVAVLKIVADQVPSLSALSILLSTERGGEGEAKERHDKDHPAS